MVGGSEVGLHCDLHADESAEHGGQGTYEIGEGGIEANFLLFSSEHVYHKENDGSEEQDEDEHHGVLLLEEGGGSGFNFGADRLHGLNFFV